MWQLLTVVILGCSLLALHIQYSFRNHCPNSKPLVSELNFVQTAVSLLACLSLLFPVSHKKSIQSEAKMMGLQPCPPPPLSTHFSEKYSSECAFQPFPARAATPCQPLSPWMEQPRTAEQHLLRSKRELGRTPDGGVRAEQQLRQHTTIANKTLPMNIHGLQSKMGLVPDRSRKTNKNCKTTHTTPQHTKPTENNPTPTNQQPTQKSVPDPIYKWE